MKTKSPTHSAVANTRPLPYIGANALLGDNHNALAFAGQSVNAALPRPHSRLFRSQPLGTLLMRPKLYLETTVPSYLTARPSRDIVRAAHQQMTKEWWQNRRHRFDVYVSQFVIKEAAAGDPQAAQERLRSLEGFPILEANDEVMELTTMLLEALDLPPRAALDASHIAIAAAHGMNFLLTWNCTHIANAEMEETIDAVCRRNGFDRPVICTPEELMGISDL